MSNSTEKHAINESLLQSYRSIFISSQSFFLALAAILFEKSILLTSSIGILCLIQIWWIWFRVVYYRSLIVDFYKFEIGEKFNEVGDISTDNKFIKEKEYVKKFDIRKKINNHLGEKNLRITRIKIDIILPIIFSLIWLLFLIADLCFNPS
jgi:hypothetical protein